MSQSESLPSSVAASDLPEVTDYKPVSLLAVLTFVLGIASCLALAGPVLFIIPSAALLVSILAFRSIAASDGMLIGRKLIIWGLVLAAFFSTTSIARTIARRELAVRDARQLARTFLTLIQKDEPQMAHQLQYRESQRQPPRTSLWTHYRTSLKDYEGLQTFVNDPLVRTLRTLGGNATVQFYAVEEIVENSQGMAFSLLYTVTYEEDGKPQTFFARVAVRRELEVNTGILDWSIDNYEAGVRPYVPSKKNS